MLSGVIAKLPAEFFSKLAIGEVDRKCVPKKYRSYVGKIVSKRTFKAKRMLKSRGELYPSYLTKSELRRFLLIYYWEHQKENFNSSNFYSSSPWRLLRVLIFEVYGAKCMRCSSFDNLAIDHIKSRSYFAELQLDPSNMQVLCRSCNSKKGSRDYTDYRPENWRELLKKQPSIETFQSSSQRHSDLRFSDNQLPDFLSLTQPLHEEEPLILLAQMPHLAGLLSLLKFNQLGW